MNSTHKYEVRRLDGTVFAPRLFSDLPPQFKALSWLYAPYVKDSPQYVRILIRTFVQERGSWRSKRVYSPR